MTIDPAPDEAAAASWPSRFPRVFRHRNYRLFFAGQSITLIGGWIQAVALSWLVYRLTQSPLLLGYNATKPKPGAEILLATERGEPLLATWRYGLGQTAAFTSDAKARWASEWLTWPGYAKFWTQVARGLMRKGGPAAFEVTQRELGDELDIRVDAVTPEGGFRNRLPITVHARRPDDSTQTVTATQDGPGSYRARVSLPPEGITVIHCPKRHSRDA